MPRRKISEYRAKKIVCDALGSPYAGLSVDTSIDIKSQIESGLSAEKYFAVKVDQGVKGRFKKGLVLLAVPAAEVKQNIEALRDKGYRWILVEPIVPHEESHEHYLSLSRERGGTVLRYSAAGGVEIEAHAESIQKICITDSKQLDEAVEKTNVSLPQMQKIIRAFDEAYMSFLEINPYIINPEGEISVLDLAIEVDSAGSFFTDLWGEEDFREYSGKQLLPQELTVQELAKNSPASFKLDVINPDGSIFLLLSGGGASIVIADEFYNRGFGSQLANYGEYSGNPNTDETAIYASAVLELLLQSSAPKKILFIGGAVANFTDVAKTFQGIIRSIDGVAHKLTNQSVQVFVRRGGPNQEVGLANIERALKRHGILGSVHDTKLSIPDAVQEAVGAIS